MSAGGRVVPPYVVRWCRHNLVPPLGQVVGEVAQGHASEAQAYIKDKVLNTDEKPRTSLYEAGACAATDVGVAMCAVALASALPSLRVSGKEGAQAALQKELRGRKGSVLVMNGVMLDAAPAGAACATTMERSPGRCGFYPAAPLHWDLLHGPGDALVGPDEAARHVLGVWSKDAPSVFEVGQGGTAFGALVGLAKEHVERELEACQGSGLPSAWFEGRARKDAEAQAQVEWLRGLP